MFDFYTIKLQINFHSYVFFLNFLYRTHVKKYKIQSVKHSNQMMWVSRVTQMIPMQQSPSWSTLSEMDYKMETAIGCLRLP